VEAVNAAGPEHRQDLREYAIDLLREGTEVVDAPVARPAPGRGKGSGQNPLGLGLLLMLVGLPLSFLFAPMGIGLVAVASVMCLWGIVMIVFRR
jgi:hypothetical protein